MILAAHSTSASFKDEWGTVRLETAAQIVSGFGFPKDIQGRTEGDLPFFKVADISAAWKNGQQLLSKAQNYISEQEAKAIKAKPFPKGAVVFAKIGEAIKLNRRAILGQPSLVDNNVMGLIPREGIDHLYLFYWTLTQKLGEISQATTVPSVRKSDVEQLKFPLAPLDQQIRIVAEIEKQFSRLDEAVADLKRIKANLKRYKAAVLKAAVEGRLVETEASIARREGRQYETGEQLLQRITATRRSQWKGKGKYKEPAAPDTSGLPVLPEGWVWVTLDQLLEFLRNGISTKPDGTSGLPILRISAVRPLAVNLEDVRYLDMDVGNYESYVLVEDDLLFTRYNGNPDLVGVCGVVPKLASSVVHPDKVIRCKLVTPGALPDFVAIAVNVGASREYLSRRVRTTAGQAGISGSDLKTLPIPIPPMAEQIRVSAEIEHHLSILNNAEIQVDINLKRAARLRESLLRAAFEEKP